MSSDLEVIKRIVDAFERSDWAEIDVRCGSLRIHLSTTPQRPATPLPPEQLSPPDEDLPSVDAAESPTAPSATDLPAGAHVVVSPSPGIFWRSPQPGAPPFADIGDRVEPVSTMCIIEVMKLMNHVKAAVSGTVIRVFLDDGVSVEQGDALFAVSRDD